MYVKRLVLREIVTSIGISKTLVNGKIKECVHTDIKMEGNGEHGRR